MHPLCLDFLTAVEASPPELATLAAVNGCQSISFMVHPVQGVPDFGMASDTPMRRETKQRCADLGVTVDMIEGFLLTPDVDVSAFGPSLESAAWLGARSANVVLRDSDESHLAASFTAFRDLAASYGIVTLAEWSRRTCFPSPAAIRRFLADVGNDALLQVDFLHTHRGGFGPADIAALDPRIVGRGQISDGPAEMPVDQQFAEAIGGRLAPGEGALPLGAFIRALPPGAVIGIEVPSSSRGEQGGTEAWVKRVLDATRRLFDKPGEIGPR
jgi:sugar phosphate isomerase/epimerase